VRRRKSAARKPGAAHTFPSTASLAPDGYTGCEPAAPRPRKPDKPDPSARGLSSVDALVLTAVHRIAHEFDSERLIWLYDIDLIARGLTH
jgi:hypothetical protein